MYHHGHNKMKPHLRRFCSEEKGSISLLVIGLFIVLMTTSLLLTDISSIYLAKRSLSIATEAAVQRGLMNLNESAYYVGEYNTLKFVTNLIGEAERDSGIPIDCQAGLSDAEEVMRDWHKTLSSRANLEQLQIEDFQCDGYRVNIETSAIARIPISLPFIYSNRILIRTHAGAYGKRAVTN